MTTFVLSQLPDHWHIARYANDHTETVADMVLERDAYKRVMEVAQREKPSMILQVGLWGDTHVLAKFDA